MINPQDFSKSKPVVKPADLGGANVAVLTVTHAEEIELGGDKKIVMQFEQFPDMNYFPNLTSIRNLCDALGNDETKWEGKSVVLEVVKTNDPVKKRQVEALWVASSDTWPDHIRAATKRSKSATQTQGGNAQRPASGNAAQKTTAKRR